ncbi:LysR family transcriptional regulator [Sphingomonas sp. Leaf357]|uniref:LysR family transcriptional regulator n=1 Tax=Sphingomonas sp. Leaf357 TaxID=1736350 RepID=UPI0006F3915D|nr:LysR family transcriptional regulator [Sphingomonas sp. Leaf357]KQS03581.1 LysR family transcriptional regulator [Sphingomonas sp. Leaf357]
MDSLTLDQIQIFLAIVDEGSFSRAAKRLNRAQSAVTYGIQKLEAQFDLPLFDRAAYRPQLTEAGRTLLVRARRIAEEAGAFRDTARSLASGLEAELTIVLDAMFPVPLVVPALQAFTARFPTVPPRIYVDSLGAATELVLNGTGMIGLLPMMFTDMALLRRFPLTTIELVPVVAAGHPLAAIAGMIATTDLHAHVQLVLTDRSTATAGRDFGVLSGRTWRIADLGAKQAMLLAGLGWGNMPAHMIAEDVKRGRLIVIKPAEWHPENARVVMSGAYLADRTLGPAGTWMVQHLAAGSTGAS